MNITPYDPLKHEAFVRNAIRKRAYDWPYIASDESTLLELARRTIVRNPRGCLVAHAPDDADLFYGYALVDGPQLLTYAYTKDALRGPGAFDAPVGTPYAHAPVMTTLLTAAGVDTTQPIGVRIWSRAASRVVSRGGYRAYPVPME